MYLCPIQQQYTQAVHCVCETCGPEQCCFACFGPRVHTVKTQMKWRECPGLGEPNGSENMPGLSNSSVFSIAMAHSRPLMAQQFPSIRPSVQRLPHWKDCPLLAASDEKDMTSSLSTKITLHKGLFSLALRGWGTAAVLSLWVPYLGLMLSHSHGELSFLMLQRLHVHLDLSVAHSVIPETDGILV